MLMIIIHIENSSTDVTNTIKTLKFIETIKTLKFIEKYR